MFDFISHIFAPDTDHFEQALVVVLRHEGGYVHHPHDPGGRTKYGISQRSYPKLDIKNLTLAKARQIYRRDFWDRYGYDRIRDGRVATKIFDMTVNKGGRGAHFCVQRAVRACGVAIVLDGIWGPKTLKAVNKLEANVLLPALRAESAGFYRLLAERRKSSKHFLRGWLKRAYS